MVVKKGIHHHNNDTWVCRNTPSNSVQVMEKTYKTVQSIGWSSSAVAWQEADGLSIEWVCFSITRSVTAVLSKICSLFRSLQEWQGYSSHTTQNLLQRWNKWTKLLRNIQDIPESQLWFEYYWWADSTISILKQTFVWIIILNNILEICKN